MKALVASANDTPCFAQVVQAEAGSRANRTR